MSVCGLLRFKKVTSPRTDSSPQIVLAKSVVLVDWLKMHEAMVLHWPQGPFVDILGCPEDQLGTPAPETPDTEIVKVGLKLGNIVGRGLGRNTG